MTQDAPSLPGRISLALGTFFAILGDRAFAARIQALRAGAVAQPAAPAASPQPAAAPLREAAPDAALQVLGLLQREARFIDFMQEDLAGHADADIGAAVRVVHAGCRKVLQEHFRIEPVRTEAEGSRVTLQPGFDASSVKLTGNVVGQPPFTGTLSHRGWRAAEVKLPKLAEKHDARVLAQAEVEL
jgi:hypothetical protein